MNAHHGLLYNRATWSFFASPFWLRASCCPETSLDECGCQGLKVRECVAIAFCNLVEFFEPFLGLARVDSTILCNLLIQALVTNSTKSMKDRAL